MIAGTMGGIMIGAMPGLTSVMGVTLLLPFTYGMDPAAGISMLLAISFGAIYGGSITAILIGAGLMAYAILFAVQGVGAFTV